jgi:shikimate kinase
MGDGHVVLVGMMGSGKTTTGRHLAKVLGRSFVDADEAFVGRFGRTVAEVFATDGEPGFRALESELLAALLDVTDPLVIAAGGGVVVTEGNRALLARPDVHVVYLEASPGFLASRARARAHRPLLAGGDVADTLERLHGERHAWYLEVADDVVDVSDFATASTPKRALAEAIGTIVRDRQEGAA